MAEQDNKTQTDKNKQRRPNWAPQILHGNSMVKWNLLGSDNESLAGTEHMFLSSRGTQWQQFEHETKNDCKYECATCTLTEGHFRIQKYSTSCPNIFSGIKSAENDLTFIRDVENGRDRVLVVSNGMVLGKFAGVSHP